MPSAPPIRSVPTPKSDDILQRTLRNALLPPLLAIGLLLYLLITQVQDMQSAAAEVARTDRVLSQADRTLRLLIDMETAQRGFLIGGDPKFLAPYTRGQKRLPASFAELSRLARAPEARQQIVRLRRLQARWQSGAATEIALRREDARQAVASFNRGRSRQQMRAVRTAFDQFIQYQQGLREARSQAVEKETRWLFTVGTGTALGIGALLSALAIQQLRTLSGHYYRLVRDEQEAREYMTTTLQSIGDAVLVTDNGGRITLMNTVAETLTGWRVASALGKPHETIFDIYHEDTAEKIASPVESVLRSRQTVSFADHTALRTDHTALRRRNGQEIPIEDSAAPIFNDAGDLLGVVLVFRDVSERKAKEAELARLVEKDRRIAETLQRSMLLTPPDGAFPHLSVAMHYESAWDEALVGGDFHDAFRLSGGKVALIVGDVTGKGLEAAAYTAEIKYVLRAYLRENPDPAVALSRLNRFLVEAEQLGDREDESPSSGEPHLGGNKMVAVALAVMEADGETCCAAAGAESPIVLWADGRAEELSITGSVAGMRPDADYDSQTICLVPGDVLIFTSDGITEARGSRRQFFGPEGIIAAARENLPSPGTLLDTAALYTSTLR